MYFFYGSLLSLFFFSNPERTFAFPSRPSFGICNSLSTRYRSRWMRIRMEALLSRVRDQIPRDRLNRRHSRWDLDSGLTTDTELEELRSQKPEKIRWTSARQPVRPGATGKSYERAGLLWCVAWGPERGPDTSLPSGVLSQRARGGGQLSGPSWECSADPRAELGQLVNALESLLVNFSIILKLRIPLQEREGAAFSGTVATWWCGACNSQPK